MESRDDIHSPASSPASSLQTSLLPSDSDHEEDIAWHPPPRPDPIHPEDNRKSLQVSAAWALFISLLFLPAILLNYFGRPQKVGEPPTPRKSASMAAFSNEAALSLLYPSYKSLKYPGLNSSSDILVIYSGMGHHRHLQNDTYAFDLQTRKWARILSGKHDPNLHPEPRWKSAAVSIANKGLLVLFGDASSSSGGGSEEEEDLFDDQVWMLNLPTLTWETGTTTGTKQPSLPKSIPQSRKGHTVNLIPSIQEELLTPSALLRQQHSQIEPETSLILFGGVSSQGEQVEELNDAWKATISWPNITWTPIRGKKNRLSDINKALLIEEKSAQRPSPRHGHATSILEDFDGIIQSLEKQTKNGQENKKKDAVKRYLVVFGGRENTEFFNDVWLLQLEDAPNNDAHSGKRGDWIRFQVDEISPVPPPRAHHTIAVYQNKLYLWGGLAGPRANVSKPLDDLWVLSFASKRWVRLYKHGTWPLPRFLFASVVHQPLGATEPRLYIFGGESFDRCKLNDLWSLNLKNLMWRELAPIFFRKERCDKLFGGRY